MDSIEIRLFNENDEQLVKDFFSQMGGESRSFFNRGGGNERDALDFFDGKDTGRAVKRWMAVESGRMVGYVFLWDLDQSVPWLGIAVADDWKGKGLGKRLMSHAKSHAIEKGKGGILLTTHMANLRGQSLYEGSGYTRMGVHTSGEILYLLRFPQA